MLCLLALNTPEKSLAVQACVEQMGADGLPAEELWQLETAVQRYTPEVLVLSSVFPGTDGESILRWLAENHIVCPPKVLYLSLGENPPQADKVLPFFTEPEQIAGEACALAALPRGSMAAPIADCAAKLAEELLLSLPMKRELKGFAYLVTLCALLTPAPWLQDRLTTCLYPACARIHHDTARNVERCARHALESTWSTGDLAALERFSGLTVDPEKGKPTTREFLALAAEQFRERIARQCAAGG